MNAPPIDQLLGILDSLKPDWTLIGGVLLCLGAGILAGWVFWNRIRVYARIIELETRQLQSQYDLVSRDVIKLKQEIRARFPR